jgi:hypothetical protein
MIDDDVIHDHVVQFNIINVNIVQDQDHHHQSKIIFFNKNKLIFVFRPRRNRPSSRDRSPQQQAANIVHR